MAIYSLDLQLPALPSFTVELNKECWSESYNKKIWIATLGRQGSLANYVSVHSHYSKFFYLGNTKFKLLKNLTSLMNDQQNTRTTLHRPCTLSLFFSVCQTSPHLLNLRTFDLWKTLPELMIGKRKHLKHTDN